MAPIQVDILSDGTPLITGGWRNLPQPDPEDPSLNLIPNGSFETAGSDNLPTGWTIATVSGTPSGGVDTSDVIDGASSLLVTTTGGASIRIDSDAVAVTANNFYAWSYFMKAVSDGGTTIFRVAWFQSDGITASAVRAADSNTVSGAYLQTDWVYYHHVVIAPPDAAFARIQLQSGGNSVRYDACELRECVTALPAGGTVWASGSFENTWSPFNHSPQSAASGNPNAEFLSDSTAPDGNYSVKYTFPAGLTSGRGVAKIEAYKTAPTSIDEVLVRFYVKFSSPFQWHSSIQKIIYFNCGQLDYDTNHIFSVGTVVPFVSGSGKEAVGFALQHNRSAQEPSFIYGGNVNILTLDTWHKVELYLKINTPGEYNGVGKVWFDDVLYVDSINLQWLIASDTGGWFDFRLEPIFGGGGSTIQVEQYIYYDKFEIYQGPFA